MRANNLTLLTDLYELTMMQGYFKNPTNQTVIFDMFYRTNPCGGSFAITAGLEQMIEYIENLRFTEDDVAYLRSLNMFQEDFLEYLSTFHFTGDIYAIPEGTVVFPREPIVKVIAPVMEAQLAWDISDTFNGMMMIPNLIGVLVLSPVVMKCTKNYVDRRIRGKKVKPMLSMFEDIQAEQERSLSEDD